MNDFQIVFLFSNNWSGIFPTVMWAIGFAPFGIVFLARARQISGETQRFLFTLFGGLFLVAGVFVLVSTFPSLWSNYSDLSRVYDERRYAIAEGRAVVKPVSARNQTEIIQVGDTQFTITDTLSRGFEYQHLAKQGGVLQDGVFARVYYHDKKILRIDIRNP